MTEELTGKADSGEFQSLFLVDLFWHGPDQAPIEIEIGDGHRVTATNVSSYKGVRVWEVPAVPGSAVEAVFDQAIAKNSTNRLVIFHDNDRQVWRWPSRTAKGSGVISRPARHVHRVGSPDQQFAAKLDAIRLPSDVVLDVNELLSRVRRAFDVETKNETKRASKLMAQMYAAVEKGYPEGVNAKKRDHEISVTLARVLFLLFGDDTEMWKNSAGDYLPDLFQDFVKDCTARDGTDIAERFSVLFEVLDTAPGNRGALPPELVDFPYVNGGLFKENIILPTLDEAFRDAVLAASAVDWSTISPAIFGSMFQSVRDARTRRELGEHYTSEENILKTLNPLFLDELRAEFDHIMSLKVGRHQKLSELWKKLGKIRFMDPACGCGNFIIVAYRELRDLELRIMDALTTITQGEDAVALEYDWTDILKVTLDHFYGIEIDEWPARIAETAMFLIDRQCDLKMRARFGIAPERFPIEKSAHIVVGNALRIDWTQVCPPGDNVIVAGNPPFVGTKERSSEQTADLRFAWGTYYDGFLDYVTGWYAKAINYYDQRHGSWAFVSTNSISQGQAVATLWGRIFGSGWQMKFAHRTFPWTSEAVGGAAVHCVIVGFAKDIQSKPTLYDHGSSSADERTLRVGEINAYLVNGPNILVQKQMHPISFDLPEVVAGSKAVDWGFLTVEPEDYDKVAADPVAAQYLRPYKGGDELINDRHRWCLWFVGADLEYLMHSPLIRARLNEVRIRRLASPKQATKKSAATPHLFEERRQPACEYLGIPQTFTDNRKYATVARLAQDVIASIKLFTSQDPDGYLFAIVSSSMFITWQKTVGGRMKSDPSFTNTIVWNTLPLPPVSPENRIGIIKAGRDVITARNLESGRSLAEQYDPASMTVELLAAHAALDFLVDRAFGSNQACGTERERQQILFARYEELIAPLLVNATARTRAKTWKRR